MKLWVLVVAAVFMHAVSFAQAALPQTRPSRSIPPEPRDGEGTASTVVPILIYHSIRPYVESDTPAVRRYIATPDALEEELTWLKQNGYVSISFDDLVNHIDNGAALPPRPVILSFDDDWESQYRYAVPLLKKYGYTATFYIWVVVVGRKHHMTWDEVRELPKEGMQLGCHTLTHPYLTRIRNDEALQREIAGAKKVIEQQTGVTVTSLAYPFGQYNARVVAAARDAGFTSARSTWPGVVHSKEGLFSLTGLIRTESEKSLVDAIQKYVNQPPLVEGVAGAGGAAAAAGAVPVSPALAPMGPEAPAGPELDLDSVLPPLKPLSRMPSEPSSTSP